MHNLILFDHPSIRLNLLPLAYTRPIANFRFGIDTIAEKWEWHLATKASYLCEKYLSKKYKLKTSFTNLFINSAYCPNAILVKEIENLKPEEALFDGEILVAFLSENEITLSILTEKLKFNNNLTNANPVAIRQLYDVFIYNGKQLEADFQRLTRGLISQKVTDPFTVLYNEAQIFIGENVSIKSAILDASTGPIFIDDNAKIEIGALIQGPFYLGKNSIISLGAKIRPNTTIGPNCKVGGEVSKSVFFGNANKSHDGFMGCSVIGEWCNWGAGTNNSNLKNDYSLVDMYNYSTQKQEQTGQLFAGTIMGDFCKTAIGTSLNTGTVTGISSNIFQQGFPPKFVPSFTWGGSAQNSTIYRLDKAIEVIKATMKRRNVEISAEEIEIITEIFNITNSQ